MWRQVFGVSAGLLVVACSQTKAAVHTASDEFRCPEGELKVDELEDDRYRVRGCGRTQVYQCIANVPCQREGWLAAKAKERAGREFDCPEGVIKVRWVQAETYHVNACGKAATYSCDDDGCWPEKSPRTEIIFDAL